LRWLAINAGSDDTGSASSSVQVRYPELLDFPCQDLSVTRDGLFSAVEINANSEFRFRFAIAKVHIPPIAVLYANEDWRLETSFDKLFLILTSLRHWAVVWETLWFAPVSWTWWLGNAKQTPRIEVPRRSSIPPGLYNGFSFPSLFLMKSQYLPRPGYQNEARVHSYRGFSPRGTFQPIAKPGGAQTCHYKRSDELPLHRVPLTSAAGVARRNRRRYCSGEVFHLCVKVTEQY